MGKSGMGKSTLLYDLLTQLIMKGAGFALLDPHGELYNQLLAFLIYTEYRTQDIRLMDATSRDVTATVNPFTSELEPDAIQTKAQVLTDLTLQVWGKESEAVRADKILYVLYVVLLEQQRPLSDLLSLLENPGVIRDDFARSEWEKLKGKPYLDSVTTRLKPLTHSRLLALTNPNQSIDFGASLNAGIILANLSRSGIMGERACKTLSAFLVAEIWSAAFSRRSRFPPFYLIIDEFATLATAELASVLTQAQKFGLHLIFLHQTENQLPTFIRDAVGNVSCFVEFVGKGIVQVDGWGSGFNETYLDPEPTVHETPTLIDTLEQFRQVVTIIPNSYHPPELLVETPRDVKRLVEPSQPLLLPESTTLPAPVETPKESRYEAPLRSDGRGGSHHKGLQEFIKSVAESYEFQAVIEQSVLDGAGSIDVSLEKEGLSIACEVSVTSSSDYECKNVLKGLRAGYDHVVVVVSNQKNIQALKAKLRLSIPVEDQFKIQVLSISGLLSFLQEMGRPLKTNKGKQEKLAGERLDFAEAAAFFDVSKSTLYRWVHAGKVPFIRVGRSYQFDRDVLVLLGKYDLSGKKKAVVNLDPVRIEKAKPKGKQQKDDRYRKMLKLD